jgi:hypothetical protein
MNIKIKIKIDFATSFNIPSAFQWKDPSVDMDRDYILVKECISVYIMDICC